MNFNYLFLLTPTFWLPLKMPLVLPPPSSKEAYKSIFMTHEQYSYVLMIGDSNRVLIVVEDEIKEERVVASSLKSHIWVRFFATSRGFLGTTRHFLQRVVAH